MTTPHRSPLSPALVACALAACGSWLAPPSAHAQPAGDSTPAGTAAAAAAGTLPAPAALRQTGPRVVVDAASEAVVFAGEASVTGRVIRDSVFHAQPVLELIVDLGKVTARGQRSGTPYRVQSQLVVRRPLQAFEQVEAGFSFVPDGDVLQARTGMVSFGVYYSAARGLSTTPVRFLPFPPS